MNDDEGKQYLIDRGVLRPRAHKWKRQRQYGYTAACWERHLNKARDLLITNLWRSILVVYQAEADQQAYNAMPLRDRTRYEKIITLERPLTGEEYGEATAFVKAWKERTGRCE